MHPRNRDTSKRDRPSPKPTVVILMGAWEDGFAAGFRKGIEDARRDIGKDLGRVSSTSTRTRTRSTSTKRKRRASAANKRYGREFKRLAPRYKKKSGGWKKDGFKRCAAAARKAAKK